MSSPSMASLSNPLPIDEVLPELLQQLRTLGVALLQAAPGAGKTTRVPLALLDEPWLQGRRILMLEPRRVAARAAARFMARQLGEPVGQRVGYRTRLDSQISAATRIEVVTEGILTRILQDDPSLEGYAAVIFDEFHERSLQADLGLALTLETRQALREDLRLLVMSATLDTDAVARLLGGVQPIISQGRSFPVQVRYVPPAHQPLERNLVALLEQVLRQETGSVLVFLPGTGEIRRTVESLRDNLPGDVDLMPLHGDLSQAEQDAAIQPAALGRRKLVLATAIAETSLTIEGVRVVIDGGLQRQPRFDPVTGMSRLETVRVSQAAAEQRKGRAGRLEPGVCYRLWTEAEQSRLPPFRVPEILSADLCDLVLELACWGVQDPQQLAWLDSPPVAAWQQARDLLLRLELLDVRGHVTDVGRRVGRLGLHPRLARMVLRAGELGWAQLGCELAALLSERDLFSGPRSADIHARILVLRGEMQAHASDRGWVQRVRQTAKQLRQRLGAPQDTAESRDAPGVLLAYAYPDRIGKRRSGGQARYLLANGRGAVLRDDDPLHQAPYLVAAELDDEGREARIFLAADLSKVALEQSFAAQIEVVETVAWDEGTQAVRAVRQRRLGALVLDEQLLTRVDPNAIAEALCQALVERKLTDLPWDRSSRQWQARVAFLRTLDSDVWPDVSDQVLMQTAKRWLLPFMPGYSRLAQFKEFPLQDALDSLLDYDQQRLLNSWAPTHLEVPSGSRIALDYTTGETPVLAVKLQELFGLAQTPRIANGRVPLMLHLLSPSRRPVQVTQDLGSFWVNGYPEVRKDLRGRYPKHPWPDDPLSAVPTRHTKRRLEQDGAS